MFDVPSRSNCAEPRRCTVSELAYLSSSERIENVVLFGHSGVSKTHIAGYRVRCIAAADLMPQTGAASG